MFVDGNTEGDALRVSGVSCGDLSWDRFHYNPHAEVEAEDFHRVMFSRLHTGRLQADYARDEFHWPVGRWATHRSATPMAISWENVDIEVLSLPPEALDRASADGEPVVFTGWTPVSDQRSRLWDATVEYVSRLLWAPDSALAEPLVHAGIVQVLVAAALTSFPNTSMPDGHEAGPGHAGPASLRRALEFIDAHAGEPITIADIAQAADSTARAVQYAFSRHLDTTPTLYLRRVRLERAHQDLVRSTPLNGVTVRAIAARWGFVKPGHFSVLYREAYGQQPSRTLNE